MSLKDAPNEARELPDWFGPVADDVLRYCSPRPGLWVDLGCGTGGVGLALARASESTVLLMDPNAEALTKAAQEARASGLEGRVAPIAGAAESIPLQDGCVDVVASRGSIFFWNDPPCGLREVYRVLRPGARALIGGGHGTSYPEWARREFLRRRDEELRARGEDAVRKWYEVRRAEWLVAQVSAAGFEGALIRPTPPGFWLLFEKGKS